jgi:hypothetical protein
VVGIYGRLYYWWWDMVGYTISGGVWQVILLVVGYGRLYYWWWDMVGYTIGGGIW